MRATVRLLLDEVIRDYENEARARIAETCGSDQGFDQAAEIARKVADYRRRSVLILRSLQDQAAPSEAQSE